MSWTGNGLPTAGQIETITTENQETWTKNIQRKSKKEIRENFQSLNKGLLKNNLEYLTKQDPNIKIIIEIHELHDLNLDRIEIDGNHILRITWSTNFNGNLRQLLLQHGFNKNNLITETWKAGKLTGSKWVRVCLYWSSLQLFIAQNQLSK